jgi:hypothetical protein
MRPISDLTGPCGTKLALARFYKVSPFSSVDCDHFSAWPGYGAPPLLSRWLGEPARRTETVVAKGLPSMALRGFIDNTAMFVKVAEDLGMQGILHKDYKSTLSKLASFGLRADCGGIRQTE